ncbi:MAG: putative membrane protein insertion efficiency factor [Dehalococcoidia bacterium]|nr:putative membrane protein insertion efficiency factor [Chloroflexota bacterium]MBT9160495.1 putative membrane protein insertion efficiency factor [Chloroflexota bacterium]MBT9162561.1 putative membrane protein insertion efficiency factor [Chloroflexota bacterium]
MWIEMMKDIALGLINFYRRVVSPLTPPSCRYLPTCSQYGHESISKYGVFKGGWLTARRVVRCNPFARGGVDPVP